MDFSEIYALEEKGVRGALRVCPSSDIDDFSLLKGEIIPTEPVEFKGSAGKSPHDLVPTEYPNLLVFSARLTALLKRRGFTGWRTFPVIIYGSRGEPLMGYEGISVFGRCGVLDKSLSEKIWIDAPIPERKGYHGYMGLYFDPQSWDGSDFFSPNDTSFIFVTKRVVKAIEQAGITNISFVSVTDIENLRANDDV